MKHFITWRHLALLIITPWLILSSPVGSAKIKCWTNKDGDKECGDAVPPEYSQKSHEVIDKRGFLVEEKGRALTPEEVAEKLKEKEKQKKQDVLLEAQKRRDRVLLDTYFEEGDIIRARDSKISTVISLIHLENDRMGKLKDSLEQVREREKNYLNDGKEVPELVTTSLKDLEQQITHAQQYIVDQDQEKKKIEKVHADYIKRFRELKGTATSEQSTAEKGTPTQ